jgi:hypothetical protein
MEKIAEALFDNKDKIPDGLYLQLMNLAMENYTPPVRTTPQTPPVRTTPQTPRRSTPQTPRRTVAENTHIIVPETPRRNVSATPRRTNISNFNSNSIIHISNSNHTIHISNSFMGDSFINIIGNY